MGVIPQRSLGLTSAKVSGLGSAAINSAAGSTAFQSHKKLPL
jgi:hypothetical protein